MKQEIRKEDISQFVKARDAITKQLQNTRIQDVEVNGMYVALQKIPNKTPAEIDALKTLAAQRGNLRKYNGITYMLS